ncbi:hypothetical protein PO124_29110 [Bacillus licheniformis]|nr:hypothetical protein [Bacillus licheniformis]
MAGPNGSGKTTIINSI